MPSHTRQWDVVTFEIVIEKLRLYVATSTLTGHSPFAAFAGQAEVERFFDVRIVPAVLNHLAAQHLEQEARAPAGAMHFLAGGMKTGHIVPPFNPRHFPTPKQRSVA